MLASGSDVSDPYIITVFINHFRYNVLRSGANHTKCEGNRWANEVSPTDSAPPFCQQILSPQDWGRLTRNVAVGVETLSLNEPYINEKASDRAASYGAAVTKFVKIQESLRSSNERPKLVAISLYCIRENSCRFVGDISRAASYGEAVTNNPC